MVRTGNIDSDGAITPFPSDFNISGQAQGDVLYFDGTNWVSLAAGTDGQVLKTQGAAANPEYGLSEDLEIASQATGDVLFFDGANWIRLAPGASGTVLTSNGVGVAPSFELAGSSESIAVGGIYLSTVATNPNTLLGFGTWTAFGTGRTLVAIDGGDTDFDVVEETGGNKTHTLSIAEMPSHTHSVNMGSAFGFDAITGVVQGTQASINSGSTGGDGSHNNVPPYIVVYMWKRTA